MRINLILLGASACAALCAGPALAAPVFYCDAKSGRERAEEIRTIRTEYLPGLKEIVEGSPLLGDQAHAAEEFKEWTARLAELQLGVRSCQELREFERPKPKPTPSPPEDDLLVAVPPLPKPEDDLLVPVPPLPKPEDDLLVPVPRTPPPTAADDLLVPIPRAAPQGR